MDARISIPSMLGVQPGDVHLLRNAGGLVTEDVIRSLVVSQVEFDTDEVMVIQHTGCGMEGLADRTFRDKVGTLRGRAPTFAVGGFPDAGSRVAESVRELRQNTLLEGDVRGFLFHTDTGYVAEVPVP
jgi:carbonic anhydrase